MYEDRTRKYDPKAHEKHLIHDAPYSFSRTTARTTTSITGTLTGYKQIMRLRLKGNNKPLLIVKRSLEWMPQSHSLESKQTALSVTFIALADN